jgi:hypothetical protein
MIFRKLLRARWRYRSHRIALQTVAKTSNVSKLRKIADQSADERIRLEAALRLNDAHLLKTLAASSAQVTVRLDAAIGVADQPCLTAIALAAWDVRQGQKAVEHIQNAMLLRRVARSAQQDAIRLAAALKLEDADLLRQVARSSTHIDVHWQVAQFLSDPCMLAEIAFFKPGNMRLEPLRRRARQALLAHLDQCRGRSDYQTLLTVINTVGNPVFKLEAFVRLPADAITRSLLGYIAAQDLRYIPSKLIEKTLEAIQAGGWRLTHSLEQVDCVFCRGKGELSLKCITANDTWTDFDVFPCPDCKGLGKTPYRQVLCSWMDDGQVELRLPV